MNCEYNRQVPAFEATSFMKKFKDLWLAGHNASLLFETEAGEASATLRVALGPHPLKPHRPQEHRHITPAQERRRERREDARRSAAAEAADAVVEQTALIPTAEKAASDNASDNLNRTPAEEAVEVSEEIETAEKVETDNLTCDLCDKTFETLKGLRTHKGRQHKIKSSPIPQLDGLADMHEPNYCKVCEECPHEIVTSEDVNYHVMNDHEAHEVQEKYGDEWIQARRYCIRRGSPFEHLPS